MSITPWHTSVQFVSGALTLLIFFLPFVSLSIRVLCMYNICDVPSADIALRRLPLLLLGEVHVDASAACTHNNNNDDTYILNQKKK
ncbi:hypothetical protein, partial [Acinetobacter baumannii]|uniref:hypothetical protein n=1 Tax=Acinetobacter baumannii TaxID=470 RepID=UPI001BB469E0